MSIAIALHVLSLHEVQGEAVINPVTETVLLETGGGTGWYAVLQYNDWRSAGVGSSNRTPLLYKAATPLDYSTIFFRPVGQGVSEAWGTTQIFVPSGFTSAGTYPIGAGTALAYLTDGRFWWQPNPNAVNDTINCEVILAKLGYPR